MGMMKSIVFSGPGEFAIAARPVPEIRRPDEVLVRVLAASICGSDVHYLATPPAMPATPGVILGHECVGEVVDTGADVREFAAGDRVIVDNNISCGVCAFCQRGMPNLCGQISSMGSMIDGVFADYFAVTRQQVVKIDKSVPVEAAVFAEPLNCVMSAIKKLRIVPGDAALVLGGGPIGLLFVMLLKMAGAGDVIVSEVSAVRAAHAKRCGADGVVDPTAADLRARVLERTAGLGADIVIDAVGTLFANALDCTRKGGQVLLFGLNASRAQSVRQCDITMRGINVTGSYIGGYALKDVARLLESGRLAPQTLITHRLPMERFGEGLEVLRRGEGMKVVLDPFGIDANTEHGF